MSHSTFLTPQKARERLGISDFSLRQWCDNGLITTIRMPGGKRLYNVEKFIKQQVPEETNKDEKKRICYCRVSSIGQKDDLQRQVEFMQSKFPEHQIVTDIASGINFKRKGLRSILELACKGMLSEVVVAYRDRLCRFAFELVEWFFQLNKVKLVVLNQSLDASEQSELAEDLLAIINVFNCRINGKGKYKKIKDTLKSISEEDKTQCNSKSEVETKSGSCQNT